MKMPQEVNPDMATMKIRKICIFVNLVPVPEFRKKKIEAFHSRVEAQKSEI